MRRVPEAPIMIAEHPAPDISAPDALASDTPDAASPELLAIRTELDEIDTQLLALIARRLAIAGRVRATKPVGRTPFRPEREAEMITRLSKGVAPAPLVQRIWYALIGATLAREGMVELVVEDASLLAAARARFGNMIPVRVGDGRLAALDPHCLGAVAHADGSLPQGVRALAPLDDEDGHTLGWIVGRED